VWLKAVTQTATSASNELVRSVAETIKAGSGRPDTSELGTDSASVRTSLIERCKQAVAFVGQKSPAEVDEYKAWLILLARTAAEASKEGGFLGIGGTVVSDAESSALHELAAALGLSAV
jgi:hypothetical protein